MYGDVILAALPDTQTDNQGPVIAHPAHDSNVSLNPLTTTVVKHLVGPVDRTPEESMDDAYSHGNALVFKHICELLDIDVEHIDLRARRTAKKQLFDAITAAVSFPLHVMTMLCFSHSYLFADGRRP